MNPPKAISIIRSLGLGLILLSANASAGETTTATNTSAKPPAVFDLDTWWDGPSLTYNWFGQGKTMQDNGVYLQTNLTQFGQGLVGGTGNHDFDYGGKLDIYLHVEGQQAGLWQGISLDAHPDYLYGQSANRHGGIASSVNTALLLPEANQDIFTLSSLFLTQKIGDLFSISIGRFNTVDFTAFSPYDGGAGNTFWNTSFVVPFVEAKSIPPVSNGALLKFDTKHDVDLTLGVFDPQDASTTTGLPNLFDNGVSLLGDVSVTTKFFSLPGKQSLTGTWSDLESNALGQLKELALPQFFGTPATKDSTWSLSYHFEQAVYQPKGAADKSVGVFGTIGVSDGNPNPVKWDATFGVGGHSPIPGREDDRIGIGYYYLGISNTLKSQKLLSSRIQDEQGGEIFYTAAINKWWDVTGDIQVVAPLVTSSDSAVVLGISTGIKF